MKKYGKFLLLLAVVFLLSTGAALADKSGVTIAVPESAARGSEVTIRINVTHHGSNIFHYTKWAYIKVNGKEVARWDFSSSKTPESENFISECIRKRKSFL